MLPLWSRNQLHMWLQEENPEMCSCGGQSPISQRYVHQLSHFTCLLESIQGPLDINHGQVFDQVDNIEIV